MQLRGVAVDGTLDLDGAMLVTSLAIEDSQADQPLRLNRARGDSIAIRHSALVGVEAERLVLGGSLSLAASHVHGRVTLNGLRTQSYVALSNGFRAEGEVQLLSAIVGGDLDCVNGRFMNRSGGALGADGARISGSVFLRNAEASGEVRFVGAAIGGDLDCAGGKFRSQSGRALSANRASISGSVFMKDGFEALGEVRLMNSTIGGRLNCIGGTFRNPGGRAIFADSIHVSRSILLRQGFRADGMVRVTGARIGGDFDCDGGTFNAPDTEAIVADRLVVSDSVFLRGEFTANGEVRLPGARIGGDLDCRGGSFVAAGRHAVIADRATIGSSVWLGEGFEAAGEVRLPGAIVGGDVDCRRGTFNNPRGKALSLARAKVSGTAHLGNGCEVDGAIDLNSLRSSSLTFRPDKLESGSLVDLRSAHVGELDDDIDVWPEEGVDLRGFTYQLGPGASWDVKQRLEWAGRSGSSVVQQLEHLASMYKAAGRDGDAMRCAIAKEQARKDTLGGQNRVSRGVRRIGHFTWGITTRYGYRPSFIIFPFLAVLVLGSLCFSYLAREGVVVPTGVDSGAVASQCVPEVVYACFQPVLFTADLMLPVVNLGLADTWVPHPAIGGEIVRVITLVVVVVGWVFTVAFVAAIGATISRR